ncbi:MAG: hypothetical protein R3C40_05250 [Parvularculaceae bacterium]
MNFILSGLQSGAVSSGRSSAAQTAGFAEGRPERRSFRSRCGGEGGDSRREAYGADYDPAAIPAQKLTR